MTQASGQVGTAAELVLGSAGELAKQSDRLKQEVESFLATVRRLSLATFREQLQVRIRFQRYRHLAD